MIDSFDSFFFGFLITTHALLLAISCTTTQIPEPIELQSPVVFIEPRTLLPFSVKDPNNTIFRSPTKIRLPAQLFDIYEIAKPETYVRSGPDTTYALLPTILEAHSTVIKLASVGIWTKIFDLQTSLQGWVHYKVLKNLPDYPATIEIDPNNLLRRFMKKNSATAYSYNEKTPILVDLPKGTAFYTLKENQDKILVIVAESRSILWMAKKDIL